MLVPVVLPDLGAGGLSLWVSAWFVDEGESVEAGDPLFEAAISGLTCDVMAPASGRLARIAARLDTPAKAGDVVAWIASPGGADESEGPTR
jgi:pyruvate dehydrogenase E2 component (dihydrolipoamide acetyltransferase)